MKKKAVRKDKHYAHEAMDRIWVTIHSLQENVEHHPYIKAKKKLRKQLKKVQKNLGVAYQMAGAKAFK